MTDRDIAQVRSIGRVLAVQWVSRGAGDPRGGNELCKEEVGDYEMEKIGTNSGDGYVNSEI